MKTIKQVISENPDKKTLINAVVSRIGKESIEDVNSQGIDGGFGGFVYYKDTVNFYAKYKKDILKMAEEMAESLGEDMLSMIANFNCLSEGVGKDRKSTYTQSEIGHSIFSDEESEGCDSIRNAMAWFAAEEVCRMFDN